MGPSPAGHYKLIVQAQLHPLGPSQVDNEIWEPTESGLQLSFFHLPAAATIHIKGNSRINAIIVIIIVIIIRISLSYVSISDSNTFFIPFKGIHF